MLKSKPHNSTQSPWKDSNGRWRTLSLFEEFAVDGYEPMYTLAEAKEKYLATSDPTEYTQSYILTENWDHWQRLVESSIKIRVHIEMWRKELAVKVRSEAILKVMASDKAGDHRWLAERGYEPRQVGRPTKAAKKAEADADAELKRELERMQPSSARFNQ
jgi:hypothetical protein